MSKVVLRIMRTFILSCIIMHSSIEVVSGEIPPLPSWFPRLPSQQEQSSSSPSPKFSQIDIAQLLKKFPGKTAKALGALTQHVRVSKWGANVIDKTFECQGLRVVIPIEDLNEEDVLSIKSLSANWTSFNQPLLVDLSINEPVIDICLDDITKRSSIGSTNFHRLTASGFPPSFDAGTPPRFRRVTFQGTCEVRLSATVFGRRVTSGLPKVSIPGERLTALWEDGLAEAKAESLDVREAINALTKVILNILLGEVEKLAVGEKGAIAAKVQEAVERVITEAIAALDGHVAKLESVVEGIAASESVAGVGGKFLKAFLNPEQPTPET
jgi:hypothetical protein